MLKSKRMKKISLLSILLPIFLCGKINAQNVNTTDERLEIGGITVVGNTFSDKLGIIAVSGLEIGQILHKENLAIQQAIKALWNQKLFSDVQIQETNRVGHIVFLEISVKEPPRLKSYEIRGIKKSKVADIKAIANPYLITGTMITDAEQAQVQQKIADYYAEKGFPDAQINIDQKVIQKTKLYLTINIQKGKRVKVASIQFKGNTKMKDRKLKKLLGIDTKSKWFAKSLLNEELLQSGKLTIQHYYHSLGHLDVQFTADSTWRNADGNWMIALSLNEGPTYHLGHVEWKGNSIYPNELLNQVLDMQKGDIFNQQALDEGLRFRPDGKDVTALYMDNGYLFFQLQVLEKAIRQDTIDLEIRIQEGPQARIGSINIQGNERTSEAVIRRELHTQPGEKFSRDAIIRSQRALINLGYFNPEKMDVQTQVNAQKGTVDITYVLEEKINDQFELSAGWGGSDIGITGTLGISFNNFSLRNLLNSDAWDPYPSGDGQQLRFRIQSNGQAYQSYNMSFTEPWLGGKRPNQLSFSAFYNQLFDEGNEEIADGRFSILGLNASLGSRFQWGDEIWVSTTGLSYQGYRLNDWNNGFFTTENGTEIQNGQYHNLAFSQKLSLSTIDHPLFPTQGFRFNASVKATLPYSKLGMVDENADNPQEQFRWLEYHKWQLDGEWYKRLVGKLVFKGSVKLGYVGNYSSTIGTSPFERFQLGGDGYSNVQSIYVGTDLVSLRGYDIDNLENNYTNGQLTAQPLFAKYTAELRYPISFNPNATIWALAFAEAGNSWSSLDKLQPFNLKRSAGLGLRVHLPIFGTLGFDYGIGFDQPGPLSLQNNGRFNIILGFEPF